MVDNFLSGIRGAIQGFKRGFYNEPTFEIQPRCFGEEAVIMCYKIYYILFNLKWEKLFLIPEYIWSLFEMIELDCDPEELIYDILSYCDHHKCSFDNII